LPFEPELNEYPAKPAQRTLDKQKQTNAKLEKRGFAGSGFVLPFSPSLNSKQHLYAACQGGDQSAKFSHFRD
jgi:hypothetical protein